MSFNSVNVGKALYSLLNATAPLYPVRAPQGISAPYQVYNVLSSDPEYTKDGTWLDRVTILLTIYETTYALAAAKGQDVRTILDFETGTFGGIAIDSIVFVTEMDDYDDDLNYFYKIQEYLIRMKNNDTSGQSYGYESQWLLVDADGSKLNFFSARRVYQYLIVENTTANACQLSGGTSPGAVDLFSSWPIAANNVTAIPLDRVKSSASTFYLHDGGQDDTWNGAILNISTVSRPV